MVSVDCAKNFSLLHVGQLSLAFRLRSQMIGTLLGCLERTLVDSETLTLKFGFVSLNDIFVLRGAQSTAPPDACAEGLTQASPRTLR